ncbi:MAG: peptide chain release factor 2 [Planctomycetota bacterium]|nr:MAG: peptide chain release factor 2 [Planctomycetota bacterium]
MRRPPGRRLGGGSIGGPVWSNPARGEATVAGEQAQKLVELRTLYEELARTLDLPRLQRERAELEAKMAKPGFWDDQESAQRVVAELKGVKQLTDTFATIESGLGDLEVLDELGSSPEELAEAAELEAKVRRQLADLRLRTYFTGDHDEKSCFVTLQTGAGGLDACDWNEMLSRMLTRYATRRGYEVEILDSDKEPGAGYKSLTLHVKGRGAFGWLKSERGTHRLIRISPFDAQKRRQTAFVSVDVTPEFDDDIEIEINDSDLRVDTFSAGGPGGQHVNKTQSAIRITHLPTGIVVQCQNERNQHANRRTAMAMLKNRLYQAELEKRAAQASDAYSAKANMGFGSADRIRTYTLQPFTLVKDTRTGHEETNVDAVLDGGIDGFVEAYLKWAAAGGKK